MITIKFTNYSDKDTRWLYVVIHRAYQYLIGVACPNSKIENEYCHACPTKTACQDLSSALNYLQSEIKNDYPHCKNKEIDNI